MLYYFVHIARGDEGYGNIMTQSISGTSKAGRDVHTEIHGAWTLKEIMDHRHIKIVSAEDVRDIHKFYMLHHSTSGFLVSVRFVHGNLDVAKLQLKDCTFESIVPAPDDKWEINFKIGSFGFELASEDQV